MKFRKVMAFVLGAGIAFSSMTTAMAKGEYDYWTSRGVKYVSYLKNSFDWKANSNKIVSVDTKQTTSGILVQKGGIKKIASKSTSKKYVYDCTTTMLVGAELGGVTLGYNMDLVDRITIKNTGEASVDWD